MSTTRGVAVAITPATLSRSSSAELGPLGEHDEHVGALGRGVGVADELDAVERGAWRRSASTRRSGRTPARWRPAGEQRLHDRERRRVAQVVGAGLEREAPARPTVHAVRPSPAGAGRGAHLGDHPPALLLVDVDDAPQQREVVAVVVGDA